MKNLSVCILFSVCMTAMNACVNKNDEKNAVDPLAANIDSSFSPANDFFLYTNNGWFKNHPIPASETSNGLWRMIQDTLNDDIRQRCWNLPQAQMQRKAATNKRSVTSFIQAWIP